ncbi:MAG: hypothetical protein ABIQ08_03720 [Duganella sp.]
MSRKIAMMGSVGLLVAAGYYWGGDAPSNEKSATLPSAVAARAAMPTTPSGNAARPSLTSPFGTASYTPPDPAELLKKRKERLARDGYVLPEKYLTMNLVELTNLGKGGDPLASIQLADRYWSEADSLQSEAGVDLSESPRAIALRYFTMAARGGAGTIPETVAKRLYESGGDITTAAAWDMVAQRFSSANKGRNSGSDRSYLSMSYEQMNAANARAAEIASQIGIAW